MDKRLANLKKYKSTWKSGKTRTVRVPVVLAEQVVHLARMLDNGIELTSLDTSESNLKGDLAIILDKVDNKEKGYKSNSSSRLINDLRGLFNGLE